MDTVIVQGRESGLGQRIAARLELDPEVGWVVGGLDRPGLAPLFWLAIPVYLAAVNERNQKEKAA